MNSTSRLSSRILSVFAIGIVSLTPPTASAQLYWQGSTTGITGGANNTISTTALNWNPQADGSGTKQAFTNGSDAVFAGTGGALTFFNDLTAGDFKVDSTGYVFGVSNGDKTLNLTTFSGSALSSAVFQNNNTAARKLTIGNSANTTFSGTIQDGGAYALSVVKSGAGTLTMNGTNTFTGSLSVSGGTLVLATDSFSSSATLLLGTGTTLSTTGSARTWSGKFGGAATGANAIISGDQNLTFNALDASTGSYFSSGGGTGINVNLTNGATATFGGTSIGLCFTANATNTVILGGSGKVVVSAAIVNGGAGSTNGLDIRNTAGVTLSGANTFTGDLTIRNGGVLNVASLNNIGTDGVLGKSSNAIYTGNGATTATINWIGSSAGSTDRSIDLDVANSAGGAAFLYLNAEGTAKMTWGGNIAGRGNSTSGLTRTLSLGGNGTGGAEISGNIVNGVNGGTGTMTTVVNKTGAGIWTFSGSNTYIGKTTLSTGTLLLNGQHSDATQVTSGGGYGSTGTGHFEAANGTTLGGSGSIKGNTSQTNSNLVLAKNGSTVAPGSAIGTVGTLTLNGAGVDTTGSKILRMDTGSKFLFDLGPGGTSDRISMWNYVSNDVLLNSNTITFVNAGLNQAGTYTLFSFYSDNGVTQATSGISGGLVADFGATGITGTIQYNTSSIDLIVTTVPEPSSMVLLGLACLFFAGCCRRRLH
jgi:autotransporter-associated beta strand protein